MVGNFVISVSSLAVLLLWLPIYMYVYQEPHFQPIRNVIHHINKIVYYYSTRSNLMHEVHGWM